MQSRHLQSALIRLSDLLSITCRLIYFLQYMSGLIRLIIAYSRQKNRISGRKTRKETGRQDRYTPDTRLNLLYIIIII